MTQNNRVLQHLNINGLITSFEAFEHYGITRLAAIVFNLRCMGFNIVSERKTVTNRYGDDCNVSVYKLIEN